MVVACRLVRVTSNCPKVAPQSIGDTPFLVLVEGKPYKDGMWAVPRMFVVWSPLRGLDRGRASAAAILTSSPRLHFEGFPFTEIGIIAAQLRLQSPSYDATGALSFSPPAHRATH